MTCAKSCASHVSSNVFYVDFPRGFPEVFLAAPSSEWLRVVRTASRPELQLSAPAAQRGSVASLSATKGGGVFCALHHRLRHGSPASSSPELRSCACCFSQDLHAVWAQFKQQTVDICGLCHFRRSNRSSFPMFVNTDTRGVAMWPWAGSALSALLWRLRTLPRPDPQSQVSVRTWKMWQDVITHSWHRRGKRISVHNKTAMISCNFRKRWTTISIYFLKWWGKENPRNALTEPLAISLSWQPIREVQVTHSNT